MVTNMRPPINDSPKNAPDSKQTNDFVEHICGELFSNPDLIEIVAILGAIRARGLDFLRNAKEGMIKEIEWKKDEVNKLDSAIQNYLVTKQ
jgi:hypothetical protein